MTRLRNKKQKQDKEDAALGPSQPKPKVVYTPLPPKGPGFIEAFLSENWKQQSMVKKGSNYTVLTSLMLVLQLAASIGLIAFAGTRHGHYIVPAVAAAGYTVATINNSFDRNLHGIIGFLDSPMMITIVSMLLVNGFIGGPASILSWVAYFLCCLPFFADGLFSLYGAATRLISDAPQTEGSCTVEELSPAIEENFLGQNNTTDRQSDMLHPSDRLVPNAIASNEPLNNLVTSDWKENAVESNNSTTKQLVSFALIAGYLTVGGMTVKQKKFQKLGIATLVYGVSSLLGYFGMANAPIAKLCRTNIVSGVCAIMAAIAIVTHGMKFQLIALLAMHAFDAFQGATHEQPEKKTKLDEEFERMDRTGEEKDGPVVSFFTESWKVNSFNKKNYTTTQMVQICMFGGQLYLALIAMIGGGPVGLLSVILSMIVASAYSFFSPMRVTAVDAIQSNGSQLAVLGAATYHVVKHHPSISFYALFVLMAIDTVASCSTFFEEHKRNIGARTDQAMGLLEKDYVEPSRHGGNDDEGDYNRQL